MSSEPEVSAELDVVRTARERAVAENRAETVAAYCAWLAERAMLERASQLARSSMTKARGNHRPFADAQPRAASAMASAWLTVYPASHLSGAGQTVLGALGDDQLWNALEQLGIRGMHTGPMKRAGGVTGRSYTPTVDGHFDRIGMDIDPEFGNDSEYMRVSQAARLHGGIVIGDIIPGHTGKGFDFRLAERAYGDYPGLFQMVEIDREDWGLLPEVPLGKDSVNLLPDVVDQLVAKEYLPGRLQRTIFYTAGVKETDWTATDVVLGVDGKPRRWVYLHYFKEGQPTLDWLDPSFAAQRLVLGDALHSLRELGDSILRLDANGFLGLEPHTDSHAWSEGHPLSTTSNQLIAGLVRKLGGFTFQELNLTFEDLRDMSQGGADLSYDFVTRPAYHHALITGDTSFLRLVIDLQRGYGIDPGSLVHALQNHDELTLELVHFGSEEHAADLFEVKGTKLRGDALRAQVVGEIENVLLAAPYNLRATNGISCTTASLVAATLGVRDLASIDAETREQIMRGHLLLAMYNALQPGVFAVSGWDLVGALPVSAVDVRDKIGDGDTRWIQRGAYDLLGDGGGAASSAGLPPAPVLYGPVPAQLADPNSFASRLRHMLDVRARLRLHEARQLGVPATTAPGLLALVHELPDGTVEITALNFGRTAIAEAVVVPRLAGRPVVDALTGEAQGTVGDDGAVMIQLAPLEGKMLVPA